MKGSMSFWSKQEKPEKVEASAVAPLPVALKHEEQSPMAMLKREELPMSVGGSSDLNALLGRGAEFEGKLTFEGTVRIDAKFTGTIVTNDVLVVGEGAKISAEITCGSIVVHGEVTGNIKAKNAVELHHPAKVKGNIETPSLVIEKGVVFHGEAKMENIERGAPAKSVSLPTTTPSPVTAVK